MDSAAQSHVYTAAALGVAAHLSFFQRYEIIDTHPLLLFTVFTLLPIALRYLLGTTYLISIISTTAFTTSLFASIAIYRYYFHPLRHFPGRSLARCSQLHSLILTARSGFKWHHDIQAQHAKYGDYVRTGPSELSIADPAAISYVLGYGAKSNKGPLYGSSEESVNVTRNREWHTQRRKVWDSSLKTCTHFTTCNFSYPRS